MGAASCKNSKSQPENQQKEDKNKSITIGVFGLDDAGKTSTVKAIEGDPSEDITPTMGSKSIMVPMPSNNKIGYENNKNKDPKQRVRMIDVSGNKRFRENNWPQFYDEIHGLIFVLDASKKTRIEENQTTLENLLGNEKLKNKPILILANKQDQRGAIRNENDLKRKLNIDKLKAKHKIELCTALPQDDADPVDESIRDGFSWLIKTIEENYAELNARVTKAKANPPSKKPTRFESDDNDSDEKYPKGKGNYRTNTSRGYNAKITTEKLPSIFSSKTKTKSYSDDDDDDVRSSSNNDFEKRKTLVGTSKINDTTSKRSTSVEPKPFRSTYESFPEETPWSTSSNLKLTKSEDTFPKPYSRSLLTSDTKTRNMSPLVHDTKSYTNGSLSKRSNFSDDENDSNKQKSKVTSRFDYSNYLSNRFSTAAAKKPTSTYDDDDDDNYRKTYDRDKLSSAKKTSTRFDDDDDDNYTKTTAAKITKNYDFDNKGYQRSTDRLNLGSEYRGTSAKVSSRSKYDDDDDDYRPSSSKPKTVSKYEDDDDDNAYSKSKSTTRSTYNDDYSTSKTNTRSKYEDDDDDDDDDKYRSSASKTATRTKFEDDDYRSPSKKPSYTSSYNTDTKNYGTNSTRTRYEDDDFFTSKGDSSASRLRKKTDYDS